MRTRHQQAAEQRPAPSHDHQPLHTADATDPTPEPSAQRQPKRRQASEQADAAEQRPAAKRTRQQRVKRQAEPESESEQERSDDSEEGEEEDTAANTNQEAEAARRSLDPYSETAPRDLAYVKELLAGASTAASARFKTSKLAGLAEVTAEQVLVALLLVVCQACKLCE